jgi:CRISPR-associated endoribonuclease Cas6
MVDFEFSRIRLKYTALTEFKQPYFLGSAIRGVLGRRLKKTVCIKPREECITCEFNKTCPYTIVFDSQRILNLPSKYVMQPEYSTKNLKEGESNYVDITLLGYVSNFWEFIINSLNTVINLGKERFMKFSNVYYYHPFADRYEEVKSSNIPRFNAYNFFELKTGKSQILVKFFPTSLKIQGKFINFDEFNKDILIKSILSRVSNVANNYGSIKDKLFIDKSKFEITDVNLKPSPMRRWSNRKNKKMTIPAFEGTFLIKGELKEIYPYLALIENINIGKSVSFGLGVVKTYL